MSIPWLPQKLLEVTERTFRPRSINLFSQNLYTGALLPSGPVATAFVAGMTLASNQGEDWRFVEGTLARFKGISGKFRVWDPARVEPWFNIEQRRKKLVTVQGFVDGSTYTDGTGILSGLLPPSCGVNEARAEGRNNVELRGLLRSVSAALRHGDLIAFWPGGVPPQTACLHTVTGRANTNANGLTRVYFEPGLWFRLVPGDQCVLWRPSTPMRLISDDEGQIIVTGPDTGDVGLTMVEVTPQ